MGVASPKPGVGSSWKSSTLLVLNERIIRKIAEYPSYMSAFFDIFSKNWPKIDVFLAKNGQKWNFRSVFGCAARRKKILGFLGLQYPHRAPILTLNFALGSSWGGGGARPPDPHLATRMVRHSITSHKPVAIRSGISRCEHVTSRCGSRVA